jgi:hypothetical protein
MTKRWRWFFGIYIGSVLAYGLLVGALELLLGGITHGR